MTLPHDLVGVEFLSKVHIRVNPPTASKVATKTQDSIEKKEDEALFKALKAHKRSSGPALNPRQQLKQDAAQAELKALSDGQLVFRNGRWVHCSVCK
jgi:hypothetical protein